MPQQESLLREGIAAMKAGNKRDGRQLLMTVVEQDPNSEEAWLWLAATASTPRDSLVCLKRVLAINPQNTKAAAGMRTVTAQLEQEQRVAESASAASLQTQAAAGDGAAVPLAQIGNPMPVASSVAQTPPIEPVLQTTAPVLQAAQQPPVARSQKQGRFVPNLVVSILALLLLLGLVIVAALAYSGWR